MSALEYLLRMKRRAVALIALFAACEGSDPAPDAAMEPAADAPAVAAPLVVVTVNARCLIDDWDARLPVLADGLRASDADVIALQEVCAQPGGRDVLEELIGALAARGANGYAFTRTTTHLAWDMYSEGLALLSRHPIADVRIESLPTSGIPRKLLAARIAAPAGERIVAVTHLDHQSAPTRVQQVQAALTALDAVAAIPTVVVGDFNEAPGGGVTDALVGGGFGDAWADVRPTDAGHTFPASGPTVRIDYVWTRGETVRPTAIEQILATPVGTTFASDHVGLRATLGGS